jgi:hypothetical protein
MPEMDRDTLEDIIFFCTRGRFEGSKEIDSAGFEGELSRIQKEGFTGVLSLTSKVGDKLSSDWIILDKGETRLVIFEEDVKDKNGEKRVTDLAPKAGFLEVFSLSDNQMEEITRLLNSLRYPPPPEKEPTIIEAEGAKVTPEEKVLLGRRKGMLKIPEAPKKKDEAPHERRMAVVTKIKEVTEVHKIPEDLDRGMVMKKYRLKEPSEAYVESLLKGFREPTEEDMIKCRSMLERLKDHLKDMFGEKLAERMYEKQFRELQIEKEYMTPKDVGKLLESFQHNILEKFVGPENAKKAIKKLKCEIMSNNAK